MIKNFLKNCRKPQGLMGRFVAKGMNAGHTEISKWGISHLRLPRDAHVLDIGCGGGANIRRLLTMCPAGRVCGVDYSEESISVSRKLNAASMGTRCEIKRASVSALPFEDGTFGAALAFETVYFWPDLATDFHEVNRVIKPKGIFLICNEICDPANTVWTSRIDGMRIYSKEELAGLLSGNGFSVLESWTHTSGWLCIAAIKCERDDVALA
ncbi:MAG: class I SAM-dependent methyltransferase [Coriobacteriales bacterium]|jgi:ubiquinone/menaquinone biosynthesis C-methylase UbiE|nr:class I SAM-dependent methyltransferase [Coriobacteriales bacterium]